jgi:hypothetical protein
VVANAKRRRRAAACICIACRKAHLGKCKPARTKRPTFFEWAIAYQREILNRRAV